MQAYDDTTRKIQNAFMEFFSKKELHEITVKGICEKVDIPRTSFYYYFADVYEVLESIEDLLIENCGTQRAFALSLPALEEVRGTLLCKNCGKTGAANSASFPRLRSIGRQLAFYVNVSSFASLAFPELERVGDGLGVSDDASSDYAFYTMPSGCTGAFVLPKLKEVRGNMLLSTWNASTDRVAAFRFPALETVTGEPATRPGR